MDEAGTVAADPRGRGGGSVLEDAGHQGEGHPPPITVTPASFPASFLMAADQTAACKAINQLIENYLSGRRPGQAPGEADGGRCSSLAALEDESHQLERKPVRDGQRAGNSHRPPEASGRASDAPACHRHQQRGQGGNE